MRRFTTLFQRVFAVILVLAGSAAMAIAQGRIIGKVTDEDTGAPLGGVSVKLTVGTKVLGAFAAKDGKYEIRNVPAGSYDITANYIGFKTQKKKITVPEGGETVQDFKMGLDLLLLEEAVVIGYGTKQRKDLTGSIVSIDAKEIKDAPLPSFEQMLQGRAAGVQVIAANGMPGAPVTVRVRGTGSVTASSDPLYIIDGIPMTTGSFGANFRTATETNALADLNPNDIESMEILKDADAAAIYGARGANGVVLITTKRGQAGTTKFNASYMTGFMNISNRPQLYDGPGWLQLWNEGATNDSIIAVANRQTYRRPNLPFNIFDPTSGRTKAAGQLDPANTNWLDQVLQTGMLNEVNINASGGTEKTKFYAGATYRNESGFQKQTSGERISGRLNLDHNATEDLIVGFNVNVSRFTTNRGPVAWAGGMGSAQSNSLPIFPIFNPDGTYFRANQGVNPVAQLDNFQFTQASTRLIANGYGEYRFNGLGIPGLAFRLEAGLDKMDISESFFQGAPLRGDGVAFAEKRDVSVINWNTNTTLNYQTKIDNDHSITALIGMSVNRSDQLAVGANGRDFPNPYFTNPNAAAIKQGFSDETAFSFIGYFARLDYKFMDKYLLKASIRRDGSSRFGSDTRFGTFPAVGLGWLLSEESFLKDNETVSLLKLRASYGLSGNAEIPNFQRFGTYFAGADYNGQPGIAPARLPNTNLGWEQAAMLDVGLDFALWQGRLSGSFAFYNKNSTNLLLNVSIPASTGFGTIVQNVGSMRNSGVEISLSSKNFVGEFSWNTDFNIAFNRNIVLDNANLPPDAVGGPGETRLLPGYPIGTFFINRFAYVQPSDGTVRVQRRSADNQTAFDPNQPNSRSNVSGRWIDTTVTVRGGSALYYNLNGQLTDIYDTKDRQPLGQPYPTAIGGITNTFSYMGFDLMILVNFSIGNSIYDDAAKRQVGAVGFNWNQRVNETEQRWKKQGDNASVPRLSLTENRDINIDRWMYDGTFVRVRQITLGYRLPQSILDPIGLTNVRLYATASNLLTFTRYPGWDPEIQRDQYSAQGANLGASVTYLTPPQARGFTFGINVGF
jgi:TonB-linked SusC/RagA family outer membrane protein